MIMNITDYVDECLKKLNNTDHHKPLQEEPTPRYSRYINHLIDQAYNIDIIDEKTRDSLHIKNPRRASFSHYLKYITK